jgi:hypothetical protein
MKKETVNGTDSEGSSWNLELVYPRRLNLAACISAAVNTNPATDLKK